MPFWRSSESNTCAFTWGAASVVSLGILCELCSYMGGACCFKSLGGTTGVALFKLLYSEKLQTRGPYMMVDSTTLRSLNMTYELALW